MAEVLKSIGKPAQPWRARAMTSDLAALFLAIAMALTAPVASRADDHAPALPQVDTYSIHAIVRQPTALYVGAISIDLRTGAVRLPDGASIDQASKDFWQAVSQVFPQACRPISTEGKSNE